MRILVARSKNGGGVDHYWNKISSFLSDSVDFITIGARKSNGGRSDGFFNLLNRMLQDYYNFWRIIRKQNHEIVILNPSLQPKAIIREGVFILIAKSFKIKVIVFMRGWDLCCERKIQEHWLWLFRRVYFKADAMIVLAKDFRTCLQRWGYVNQIFIETTAVEDTNITQDDYERSVRNSSKDPFNILFLSRIEQDKGIFETIDAFVLLEQKYPMASLTIAGTGAALLSAKSYVNQIGTGRIDFLGYLIGDAKTKAFCDAHCYIFPSSHGEGMPNSVLEAMSFGLPIITRPVGGVIDFFENTRMGFLINSNSAQRYSKSLEKLINSPELAIQISEYNREYARNNFTASCVAKRITKIIRKVHCCPKRFANPQS